MYKSILKMIGNALVFAAAAAITTMGVMMLITGMPWHLVIGALLTGCGINLLVQSSEGLAHNISEYKFHRRHKERTSELGHSEEGEQLSRLSSPDISPYESERKEKGEVLRQHRD
ncbi:MAG: hypothetical protein K0R63_858 [Rickettsiales bacterium]|nr:hypothetical protein [Rickettsiales bacterium]